MTTVAADQPTHGNDRFWLLHGLLPGLIFLAGLLCYHLYNWDFVIQDLFFDPAVGRWRHGEAWWANQLLHDGGRGVIKLTALTAGIAWALSFAGKRKRWRSWRRPAAYVLLAIGLCTGVVALIQFVSPLPCPYSLAQYDGDLAHLSAWEGYFSGQRFGRCFPGKHASGGFSLFLLYYLFRDRHLGLALVGLMVGVLAGSLFSFAQMARGAHFFSHNWWSMGIDWGVITLLYAIPFQRRITMDTGQPQAI
ncbi:MAG: phosphatase PAP2 family protein [Magnetococcales bacterium]|nr:phosphatase PAP2 family protein [Magnetococcales bacterium]